MNLFDEDALSDDGRTEDNTEIHSAPLNTCSHLFRETETLRVVRRSSGRADLISSRSFFARELQPPSPDSETTTIPHFPTLHGGTVIINFHFY